MTIPWNIWTESIKSRAKNGFKVESLDLKDVLKFLITPLLLHSKSCFTIFDLYIYVCMYVLKKIIYVITLFIF